MTSPLRTIYVMDDDSFNLEVAEVALGTVGQLEVKTYARASLLLRDAAANPPDLILSDVHMPEMDGRAAFEEIRKLPGCENTPVIFMTADTGADEMAALKSMGAAEVLTKPIDPMKLAERIQSIWNAL